MTFLLRRCCGPHGTKPLIMRHVCAILDVLVRRFEIYPSALGTNERATRVLYREHYIGDVFFRHDNQL